MQLRQRSKGSKDSKVKVESDQSYSKNSQSLSEQISSESEMQMEIEEVQKPKKKIKKEVLKKAKKPVKQVKKKDVRKEFFEEEASEKESESDYEPDGEDEKVEKNELKNMEKQLWNDSKKRKKLEILDMSEDQLVEHFQKFDQNMLYDLHNLQGFTANLIDQFELPNLQDPKVFAVRCIPGKEKQFLVKILEKIGFSSINPQLSIQSVNFIDKFQGFLFFEAFKEFHVSEIIKSIPGIFKSITLIPLAEVPQIFTTDETHRLKLQRNQFVRIKSGIYKDDLAQIISWDTEQQQAIAKVVPRVNYVNENEGKRPQKELLKLGELPSYEEKRDRDNQVYIIFKGKRFINGLLIKKFTMSQIETINVIPTIEEASLFLTSAEDEETQIKLMEELLAQLNESQQVARQFAKGDKVKVIAGELQNLIGSVVSQSGNQVQVAPAFLGMNKDILNFHSSEIQKFFVEGDSVQFLQGKFKGCEGKIVSVEGEVVTIYLFEEGKYVNGLLANVQLVGLNQLNGEPTKQPKQDLRKYDLIRSICDRKPCVILRIVNNFITAIDENNDMISLNLMQIDEKLNNFRAVCLNRYHQKIIIDCSVRVVGGVNAGKSAIVKQIYQDIIFLYNEEFQKTFGIFVEKADNLYLVSSFSFQKQFRKRINYNNNKPINEDENEKPKPKRFQPGQFIIIQKGDWKGHQGLIVECDEKIARIELQSKDKIVIVPIKFLLEDQFDGMDEIITQPFGLQQPQPEQSTWGNNPVEPETNGAPLWGNNTEVQNNEQPEWGNNVGAADNNAQPDWNNNGNANESNNVNIEQNGKENENQEISKKEEHWGEQQGQQIEEESAW